MLPVLLFFFAFPRNYFTVIRFFSVSKEIGGFDILCGGPGAAWVLRLTACIYMDNLLLRVLFHSGRLFYVHRSGA